MRGNDKIWHSDRASLHPASRSESARLLVAVPFARTVDVARFGTHGIPAATTWWDVLNRRPRGEAIIEPTKGHAISACEFDETQRHISGGARCPSLIVAYAVVARVLDDGVSTRRAIRLALGLP